MNLNFDMNLNEKFKQVGNMLYVTHLDITTEFEMPEYFNINDVSDDLKTLSLICLFYPLDKELINYNFSREVSGNKIGLAYSGGVDSTAAYCLLPKDKIFLFHHKRIIVSKSMYKHDNPIYVIKNLPQDVLLINSDLEEIRLKSGASVGFLNDFSFFGGFVLLADYLGIKYLSTGMMLESTYIYKGYIYRDFHNSDYFKFWFNLFESANLPLFFPCLPCSEILTNEIVKRNNIISESCIRGIDGKGCNKCYKCFRKNIINKKLLNNYSESKEIIRFITNRPIKQGASLIYAINKYGFNIPEVSEYKNMELSWLEQYFEYTLLSIPVEYRKYLKNELYKYSTINDNLSLLKSYTL